MKWMTLLLAAVTLAGCGSNANPVAADAPATEGTEYFTGTLSAGGAASYAFTVVAEGAIHVTLTSVNTSALVPLSTPIRLGEGIPAGEGCAVTKSVTVRPALTTQLLDRLTPGIYCIEARDTGTLTGPVSFAIRIAHY